MAVTVDVAAIAVELRIIAAATDPISVGHQAVLGRLRDTATALVVKYAPGAPDAAHDEAVIRVCGFLFDLAPHESRRIQDPLGQSGAAQILAPWRVQRASTGSAAAGTTQTSSGTAGVDTEARTAAAAAQRTADEAIRDVADLLPLVTAAANPATATNAEADAGTETGLRSWSAALIRRVVNAIVPAWARAASPPSAKIPNDAILPRHIPADSIGQSEIRANAVNTAELVDGAVTSAKLARDVTLGTGRGKVIAILNDVSPTSIQSTVSGEQAGDYVIGYNSDVVIAFEYVTNPGAAFVERVRWPRHGRTDAQLETFIEGIVESWGIRGNADGIPGSKTFAGLFTATGSQTIAAGNVSIAFDIGTGTAEAPTLTDETEAAASTFAIPASNATGFTRCRYDLQTGTIGGFNPRDLELVLRHATTGVTIGQHNLKDSGPGTAQFDTPNAGNVRWAFRCLTRGRFQGTLVVTETTYHSNVPIAEPAIEHVVHPIVSDEAAQRQRQEADIRAEIARVEDVKAIVNGYARPTFTTKQITWGSRPNWVQADTDAYTIPETGFVQAEIPEFGITPVLPVAFLRQAVHGVGPRNEYVLSACGESR